VIDRLGEEARPLLPEIQTVASRGSRKKAGGESYAGRMAKTLQEILTGKKERLVYPCSGPVAVGSSSRQYPENK
jgi:hypothetical protein